MQSTKYYAKPVEIFEKDLAKQDRFLISFLKNMPLDEVFGGLLTVHIRNVNDIPTKIELNRAVIDGKSIKGYVTAKYDQYFEEGFVK